LFRIEREVMRRNHSHSASFPRKKKEGKDDPLDKESTMDNGVQTTSVYRTETVSVILPQEQDQFVYNRKGEKEPIMKDQITAHCRRMAGKTPVLTRIVPNRITAAVNVVPGMTTVEISILAAEKAASFSVEHPEYGDLAARILVDNIRCSTPKTFLESTRSLRYSTKRGILVERLKPDYCEFVEKYSDELENAIDYDLDYKLSYMAVNTLTETYLLRDLATREIKERYQHLLMRVATAAWYTTGDVKQVIKHYRMLSQNRIMQASPTLFNSGTVMGQLSSCFLLSAHCTPEWDSMEGITEFWTREALISKYGGGEGISLTHIRASGCTIFGTGGISNGIIPLIKVIESIAKYVDQCFYGDTLVMTADGPKPIRSIVRGDRVMTHTGKYQEVTALLEHKPNGVTERNVLKISVKHSIEHLRVTDKHPFLVLKGQAKGLNFDVIRNRLKRGIADLEWVDAGDLNLDDYVCFPVDNNDVDNDWTADQCRFYGIMCGDGWISKSDREIRIFFANKDIEAMAFTERFLTESGEKWQKFPKDNGSACTVYRFVPSHTFYMKRDILYDEGGEKIIHSDLCRLPLDKTMAILRGLIESDGTIGTKEITLELTSKDVIDKMRFMLMRKGILTSGAARGRTQKIYKSGHKHRKLSYVIRIPKCDEVVEVLGLEKGRCMTYLRHENYTFTRIDGIEEIGMENEETMYDLEVAEDHSYVISSGTVHNGGGKRKGAIAVYLEPWHLDVEDFVDLRLSTGSEERRARHIYPALWTNDLFMERKESDGNWTLFCPCCAPGLAEVHSDAFKELYERYEKDPNIKSKKTIKARDLYRQTLAANINTSTPFWKFKDACNRKSNQQNLGTIHCSNLCVNRDTPILTDKGYHKIGGLVGQTVNVWNGFEFSAVTVKQTGFNQEMLRITFCNGAKLDCTKHHKFYVAKQNQPDVDPRSALGVKLFTQTVEAQDLVRGMALANHKFPVITEGLVPSIHPYILGSAVNVGFTDVPINFCIQSKLRWLEGYADTCGKIVHNALRFESPKYAFLWDVRLMLTTMGVDARVYFAPLYERDREVQVHNEVQVTDQAPAPVYHLFIYASDVLSLVELGFSPKQLTFASLDVKKQYKKDYVEVVSVESVPGLQDTFCFSEPKLHSGTFNGIVTGQCTEIIQYSDGNEVAVCNLASIPLGYLADRDKMWVDYDKLYESVYFATRILNRNIDQTTYPLEEAKRSNLRHRPIGLGVCGFADLLLDLRIPYSGPKAVKLTTSVFETIYYAALRSSCDLAKELGTTYETFSGSPTSQGILQFDMWGVKATGCNGKWDWEGLKKDIVEHGLMNSLLVAPMPTATSAQFANQNECFEPYTENIYVRRLNSGSFHVFNRMLVEDLEKLKLWSRDLCEDIIDHRGSVQHIPNLPKHLKELYKTAWEVPHTKVLDMALARGPFVDQDCSFNIYLSGAKKDIGFLSGIITEYWKKGGKGFYYVHIREDSSDLRNKNSSASTNLPKRTPQKSSTSGPSLTEIKTQSTETNASKKRKEFANKENGGEEDSNDARKSKRGNARETQEENDSKEDSGEDEQSLSCSKDDPSCISCSV
jgi:ribonucleoside-diphosphate reductase alpha chain